MKRYRTPRAKSGQIKLQYGRVDGVNDLVVANGDGIPSCDRALFFSFLSSKSYSPVRNEWDDSFLEELEKRGYDIKTLKISVEKKREN
ncbi:hypothetical protein NFHSH190041_20300 [Shewanella sp. NFH-SH190041]|uniref:hypothetical protein n=1 Tax=Shewanella sp. NFH-SH190041 TaxID=2950245 RepID=UPI0021C36F96|nr:hypothetical protein [Shewanella sp. NFH-SH190041]BDM64578.1 hypothetical protein NFHSH190041_20300 [Shewanella sp. NFH-SH190041]